jgi:hypothetical protein
MLELSENKTFPTAFLPRPPFNFRAMSCITNSPDPLKGSCRSPQRSNPVVLPTPELQATFARILSVRSELISRAWQSCPEKIVFAVIYLGFYRGSFRGLRKIAENPKLNRLVPYIHYDRRQLEIDCPPLSKRDNSKPYFGLPWMFKTDSSWQFRADPHTRDHDSDSSNDWT